MTQTVDRLNRALDGRYRVEREIGEGGMATVYLANDLRHGRRVALKVLKPELAAVVGADRFLAEIRTTANLQHPHILPLFDSGEADGFLFYVMPYVEGESLRARLDRDRQLPVDEAVRIAADLAEALDYAHRQGVVHRDIKPANVLVHEGRPLIADFGIALAVGAAGGNRLTETGLSVGTPFYMSPEQATGDRTVGPATDIYSLGCVLFETLTGEPPYPGPSAQAVLGRIIAGGPVSATAVRPTIPLNVDGAIRQALEKLPADRFAVAQDFSRALRNGEFRYGDVSGAGLTDPGVWKGLAGTFAALFVAASAVAVWSLARPEPPRPVERFATPFLAGQEPVDVVPGAMDLSRDGTLLVYMGPGPDGGGTTLWIRRWDALAATPLSTTLGATQPSLSPDGQEVAFRVDDEIRATPVSGGPVRTLAEGIAPHWGPDGLVYFTAGEGIARVPAAGGTPELVFPRESDMAQLWFEGVLPAGEASLVTVVRSGSGRSEIHLLDMRGGETTQIAEGGKARYVGSGHLLFTRSGSLMAAPFDVREGTVTSPAVPVVEDVWGYRVSETGKLFYTSGVLGSRTPGELIWLSRAGAETPVDAGWVFDNGGGNGGWSISPDGDRIALLSVGAAGYDIWVKDLDAGPPSRFTFHETEDRKPQWGPEGETITFLSARLGQMDVWSKPADGTGEARLLYDHDRGLAQGFWSPDGEWLILRTAGRTGMMGGRDILALRPGVDSVPLPIAAEPAFDESHPSFSPDGRYIAYNSAETGSFEVFVRPFPDATAGKWQVSTQGGVMPLFAHSGREMFYVDPNRNLVAVEIETSAGFRMLSRQTLFAIPPGYVTNQIDTGWYDITPDDQRFLMFRHVPGSANVDFVLVNNFLEELRERVPG